MGNGEDALASNPLSILVFDLAVVEDSGPVELDTSSMYGFGERDFVWVEVLPARLTDDFVRLEAKYVDYGIRDV